MQGRSACLGPVKAAQPKIGRRGRRWIEMSERGIEPPGNMGSVEDRMGTILKQGTFPAPIHSARLVILAPPDEARRMWLHFVRFSRGPRKLWSTGRDRVWTFIRKW